MLWGWAKIDEGVEVKKFTLRALRMAGYATLMCVMAAPAFAAPETKPTGPQVTLLDKQISELETQIAVDLAHENDVAAADRAKVDLQIDIHLIERWLLAHAADAPLGDPLQVCATLRAGEVASVGDGLVKRYQSAPSSLTPTQLDGLHRLHEMTYKLPAIKSVADLDSTCQTMATDLILAAGPNQGEVDKLPKMRPAAVSDQASEANRSQSLSDLVTQAQSAEVSGPLRHELEMLARYAATAASDVKKKDEAQALEQSLRSALTLIRGLPSDALAKPQAEAAITQALALINDPRTREAGFDRLASLNDPQQLIGAGEGISLPAASQTKLASAMDWAQRNPEKGELLLAVIRRFAAISAEIDQPHSAAGLSLNQQKAIDLLQKQIIAERTEFLDAASAFDPLHGSTGTLSRLRGLIDRMRNSLDLIGSIERLNKSVQVLSTYKLRPYGMLERRSVTAMTELAGAMTSARRDAAIKFVQDTDRLGQIAGAFTAASAGISPQIKKQYMGDQAEAVETHRANLVSELGTELGSGKPLDRSTFARLESFNTLYASLREAETTESIIQQMDSLTQWVDWTISSDQLRAALQPYQDATIAAFTAFLNDDAAPMTAWPAIHNQYVPLIRAAAQAAQNAQACSKLPTGYFADCAKLMTPMSEQPYAAERETSFALSLWSQGADATDTTPAQAMIDWISKRLAGAPVSPK